MVQAHAHEAVVGCDIVDAVGDRLADGIGGKVVDIDQLGLALRLPFASHVLEITDQFLLLRVNGDHRNAAVDAVLGLGVDVLELRVASRMLSTLDGFARSLQAGSPNSSTNFDLFSQIDEF